MLALDLSPELEECLDVLAARAGMSKTDLALEAIKSYLEDLEDGYLAQEALSEGGKPISLSEVMNRYGVEEKV